MRISKSDRSNLILTTAELLRHARLMGSGRVMFRGISSITEHVRDQIGEELDGKISSICGEAGLTDFIRHELMRETLQKGHHGKSMELVKADGYDDTIKVAERLVDGLIRLPHKLRIISPLPQSLSTQLLFGLADVELGNGVRLMRGDKLAETSRLTTDSRVLDSRVIRIPDIKTYPLNSKSHFFVSWHSGYAGNFYGNYSILDHLDRLRAFNGCFLALQIVEDDFVDEDETPQSGILVHDVTDSADGPLVLTSRVDSDLTAFYENHSLDDDNRRYFDDDADHAPDEASFALTEEQLAQRQKVLDSVKVVFGGEDHNRRIFTSSLWLFRAYTSTRPMDQILYATIAIEVLLGDRETADRIGLTKLLANRCAYLLGESRSERDKIMDEFKGVYDIRSQIVHAGLHQFGREVEKASERSKALAARVIRKELALSR